MIDSVRGVTLRNNFVECSYFIRQEHSLDRKRFVKRNFVRNGKNEIGLFFSKQFRYETRFCYEN